MYSTLLVARHQHPSALRKHSLSRLRVTVNISWSAGKPGVAGGGVRRGRSSFASSVLCRAFYAKWLEVAGAGLGAKKDVTALPSAHRGGQAAWEYRRAPWPLLRTCAEGRLHPRVKHTALTNVFYFVLFLIQYYSK